MNTSRLQTLSFLALTAWLCFPGLLRPDGPGRDLPLTRTSLPPPAAVDDPKAGDKAVPARLVEDRTDWLLGKIEPAVEEAWKTQEELQVIVYLRATAHKSDLPAPSEVKALHLPAIEELSHRIRAIEKRYHPALSVPEDQEKSIGATLDPAKSDADKAELHTLRTELDRRLDRMRVEVGRAIEERVAADQTAMAELIEKAGGQVTARVPLVNALGATIPGWYLMPLAEDPRVAAIVEDPPVELELNVSGPSAGFDFWHGAGFDGGIWDAGIIDTGVQEDHPAFSGISFFSDWSDDLDGHGTHVAGIIASAHWRYTGGAPGLDSLIWAPYGGLQTTNMSRMHDLVTRPDFQAPEVVNYSLGYGVADDSDYDTEDSFFDAYIENFDVLVTKSAGNSGWSSGSPTITHPAPAYNLLAVANMDDQNTGTPSAITHPGSAEKSSNIYRWDDVRSEYSSVGPTLGGRKKPDITAPGTNIMSTNAFWEDGPDFVSKSGTSMAAPQVAAAVVLLQDGGNTNAMAQTAVLINTADAWTSNNTESTGDDGPVSGSRWDKSYGWGYLDMEEALFNRDDYYRDSVVPRNDNATEDDYKLYAGFMYDGEKATLVWQKRGSYLDGQPPTTTYALSDLDLKLYDEADGSLEDSDIDFNDNVHQVAASSDIDTVIKVYAFSSLFDGASSEPFALATEENFTPVQFPDDFQGIFAEWAATLEPGVEAELEFWVVNNGDIASHNNQFELVLPDGLVLTSGSASFDAGSVPAGGESAHATWGLMPQQTGSFTVQVRHTHSSYEESFEKIWNFSAEVPVAVPIPVDNFSFEALDPSPGVWDASIPSWDQTGETGTYRPPPGPFLNGVPDGHNSAFSNLGTLRQTITAETLLADTTYTLSVDVGDRADKDFPGYEIQLLVNGIVRASADQTSATPSDGTFDTATTGFTTTPADAGQSVEILLEGSGEQTNFDNVRLTRSAGGNAMPEVGITSPSEGEQVPFGTSVIFDGNATDTEDGDLADSLSWTSSLDEAIGSGESFVISNLSCGIHSITASVTDSGGLPGSDTVTLTVIGGVPVPIGVAYPSFEMPVLADGDWDALIQGWDQTGNTGTYNPPSCVPGGEPPCPFPGGVPEGDNSAYSDGGTIAQTIAETLFAGTTYTLSVDVGRRADQGFPAWRIQLVVDGVVRANARQTLVELGGGNHQEGTFETATASFTTRPEDEGRSLVIRLVGEAGKQTDFDNVRLTRGECGGNSAPVVVINRPDGPSIPAGKNVRFVATAFDAEDGDLAAGLKWISSFDGVIGFGPEFETSLPCGLHAITASVTDSGGLPGSDAVTVNAGEPIAVENPSFEDTEWDTTVKPWDTEIESWIQSGITGTYKPPPGPFPDGVPDGEKSAYSDGGSIRQTIAEELFADTTYTLSVDVGRRADQEFPGYKVLLVVEGESVHRARADESTLVPGEGEFGTVTVSFTTTQEDEGKSVEIRLVGRPGKQTNFDNVWLTRSVCGGDPSDPG